MSAPVPPLTPPPRPTVEVRPVHPADATRLGEITVAAYVTGAVISADDDYVAALRDVATRMRETLVLAAYRGTEVLGGITLAEPGTHHAEVARDGEIELRMLAVDPAHQGEGVAEALLGAAAEAAAARGRAAVVLSTVSVSPARRLYKRLGFAHERDRDWVGDWDEAAVAAGTADQMCVYRLPL